MPLLLHVVFAASDVNRGGAVGTRDAVSGVKIEPEVAHLQGHQFRHSEAADRGQSHQKSIAIVPQAGGPEAKQEHDEAAVDRETERRGPAEERREAACPSREIPESVDGGVKSRYPVPVLDRCPNGG
jgi:hypothetical protein